MNGGSGLSQPVAETRYEVRLRVNGIEHAIRVPARRVLADALRHDLGLTGTHLGCEHGVCGACTALLDGAPVRACLLLAVTVDGAEITTVEGCLAPDDPGPPGTGDPAPGTGSPHSPGTSNPDSPGTGSPHLPATGSPDWPGTGSPHSPGTDNPHSPGTGGGLGPVQQAFTECHGLQCRFCT